jgi:hypothetical protein
MSFKGFAAGALVASIVFATVARAGAQLAGGVSYLPSGTLSALAGSASGGLPDVTLDWTPALAPLAWAGLFVLLVTCLGLVRSARRRPRRSTSPTVAPAGFAKSGIRNAA